MKYSTLQYRAIFSFLRDASAKGCIRDGFYMINMEVLKDLCKMYLSPVGLRMKENKRDKGTISIERNDIDNEG